MSPGGGVTITGEQESDFRDDYLKEEVSRKNQETVINPVVMSALRWLRRQKTSVIPSAVPPFSVKKS